MMFQLLRNALFGRIILVLSISIVFFPCSKKQNKKTPPHQPRHENAGRRQTSPSTTSVKVIRHSSFPLTLTLTCIECRLPTAAATFASHSNSTSVYPSSLPTLLAFTFIYTQ